MLCCLELAVFLIQVRLELEDLVSLGLYLVSEDAHLEDQALLVVLQPVNLVLHSVSPKQVVLQHTQTIIHIYVNKSVFTI